MCVGVTQVSYSVFIDKTRECVCVGGGGQTIQWVPLSKVLGGGGITKFLLLIIYECEVKVDIFQHPHTMCEFIVLQTGMVLTNKRM